MPLTDLPVVYQQAKRTRDFGNKFRHMTFLLYRTCCGTICGLQHVFALQSFGHQRYSSFRSGVAVGSKCNFLQDVSGGLLFCSQKEHWSKRDVDMVTSTHSPTLKSVSLPMIFALSYFDYNIGEKEEEEEEEPPKSECFRSVIVLPLLVVYLYLLYTCVWVVQMSDT